MIRARGDGRIGEGNSIGRGAISQPLAIRFEICLEGAAGEDLQPLIAAVDSSDDEILDSPMPRNVTRAHATAEGGQTLAQPEVAHMTVAELQAELQRAGHEWRTDED